MEGKSRQTVFQQKFLVGKFSPSQAASSLKCDADIKGHNPVIRRFCSCRLDTKNDGIGFGRKSLQRCLREAEFKKFLASKICFGYKSPKLKLVFFPQHQLLHASKN